MTRKFRPKFTVAVPKEFPKEFDIDFCLVQYGKVVRLIQVAYTIEGEKTRKRELKSLFGAGRKLGCGDLVLITDHESDTVVQDGLTAQVVSAPDWLSHAAAFASHSIPSQGPQLL